MVHVVLVGDMMEDTRGVLVTVTKMMECISKYRRYLHVTI